MKSSLEAGATNHLGLRPMQMMQQKAGPSGALGWELGRGSRRSSGVGIGVGSEQTEKAAICSPCQPTANGIIYPTETSKNAVGLVWTVNGII
jgi:hypothetical protein